MWLQGNCAAEFPTQAALGLPATDAPLHPRLTGRQCLLLADSDVLQVTADVTGEAAQMWLDGVYLRLTQPRNMGEMNELVKVFGDGVEVWVTDCTLQGNGNGQRTCTECGLECGGSAKLYVEGARLGAHCSNKQRLAWV